MKYVLKTEVNEKGREVFAKERRGKSYVYIAYDQNNKVGIVDKDWLLKNKDAIVNLGVDKNGSIYPVHLESITKSRWPKLVAVERLTTLKLELEDDKEIYVMYKKPEPNKYRCDVILGKKGWGLLEYWAGLYVPQEVETGIRTDSDAHFEKDIIGLIFNNIGNDNLDWNGRTFEEDD